MSPEAIAQSLAAILPANQIASYDSWTPVWQTALSHAYIGDASSLLLVAPKTGKDLSAVMALAYQSQWKSLVAGQGTKLGWGIPAKKIDLLVSTHKVHNLVDHAVGDMTVPPKQG